MEHVEHEPNRHWDSYLISQTNTRPAVCQAVVRSLHHREHPQSPLIPRSEMKAANIVDQAIREWP